MAERSPKSLNSLAIDIGGTKLAMAVFGPGRQVLARQTLRTDAAGGREWMLERILDLAGRWRKEFDFVRCGVGFGGPVDFPSQRIARSMHVGGWIDFPLTEFLKEKLGVPVLMDNDANVGALGEFRCGAGLTVPPVPSPAESDSGTADPGRPSSPWPGGVARPTDSAFGGTAGEGTGGTCALLFYMTISTGIGGGMVIGGKVNRGIDSMAGEIGHTPVRADGPECLCGSHGCLERLCCGLWLQRDHGRPAEELFKEPAFVERYCVDLARGLKIIIMLLNPARIVIGGGISRAGDVLFAPLRKELLRQLPPTYNLHVDVVPAALGNDSVLYGAMCLAEELA